MFFKYVRNINEIIIRIVSIGMDVNSGFQKKSFYASKFTDQFINHYSSSQ